jgi:hypothetical protein
VPGGAKPAAAAPDDDTDGNQYDEDNVLIVSDFDRSGSAAGTGTGAAWWGSAGVVGGAHAGADPGVDDIIPGFGGGARIWLSSARRVEGRQTEKRPGLCLYIRIIFSLLNYLRIALMIKLLSQSKSA